MSNRVTHTAALYTHERFALQSCIRNRTAAIYLVLSPRETFAGSAICVAIENRIFIATAAHNFRGLDSGGSFTLFSANRSSDTPLAIIGANYRQNLPDGLPDIAWLEIDPASAAQSELIGVSLESIVTHPTLDPSSLYMVTGFPTDLRREENRTTNHTNFVVPLVLYVTHALPQQDLAIGDVVLSYQREGLGPDGFGIIAEPHGMSGGGIWHVQGQEDNLTVWNAGRTRLIGLTTTYGRGQNEIRGVRMHHWLQLLMDDLPELRPLLQPLLQRE